MQLYAISNINDVILPTNTKFNNPLILRENLGEDIESRNSGMSFIRR